MRHCLLASFGVDYKFLARQLAGSPATSNLGGVVVVDNHQGHEEGSDASSYAPWEVITPPFFSATESSVRRVRMERGTMHPKLWLIELDDGQVQHGQSPPLGSAPARPLCLLSAHLAALGSSALPG